ncbi:MAG: bacterioferritin [Vicinamibacterales bacterium]
MRGDAQVIARLNQALQEELTAINQYFVHAEMLHNWGYHRLGSYIRKQSIDEMKHAEKLLERVLFLEGTPVMQPMALTIGADVRAQFRNDLDLELKAVVAYNDNIKVAMEAADHASRDLFASLLRDEEGHVDFLETQLQLIEQIGLDNYLAQQLGDLEERH